MKERPILFNAQIVQAILEGRKTQTRRIIKWPGKNKPADIRKNPDNDHWYKDFIWSMRTYNGVWADYKNDRFLEFCKQGKPGDRLWVKETWCDPSSEGYPIMYRAECENGVYYWGCDDEGPVFVPEKNYKWKPSIFMRREYSRILLEIIDIKVERIQDISEEDAKAEGVESLDSEIEYENRDYTICPACGGTRLVNSIGMGGGVIFDTDCFKCDTHKKRFMHLWESINKKRGYGWDVNPWVWVINFKLLEVKR